MTLCIAAETNGLFGDQRVVVGFDWRIETQTASSQVGFKFEVLSDNWIALLAGPLVQARELTLKYSVLLRADEDSLTEGNVLEYLRGPAFEIRKSLAEAYTRSTAAMSYEDFLEHGESMLPEDLRRQIAFDISKQRVEAEVILVGWVESGFEIFQILDGNVTRSSDFATIGSGSHVAEVTLYRHEQNSLKDLGQTLYAVYEAKRLGEISPGVGTATSIGILFHNEKGVGFEFASDDDKAFLERQFRRFGPKAVKYMGLPPDLSASEKLREPKVHSEG